MNCQQCQLLLQHQLDGLALADRTALDSHLEGCDRCAGLFAAGARLESGLRQLPWPSAPAHLAQSIVAQVQLERQSRLIFRRRITRIVALAASVMLAMYAGYAWWGGSTQPDPRPIVVHQTQPEPKPTNPSLRDEVTEAGQAVVSLTRRTADETVSQTAILIPTMAAPAAPEVPAGVPFMDANVQNLWASTGQGMTASFQPLTNSARRAFGMLMRDQPTDKKDE